MPDLPSGTVTFLFTDIEGSTALWEHDRQAMAAAVARHLAILDTAIQTHDGFHFKTVGDAVQAAFPTAPAAVAAALAAQRALLAEPWGAIGPLRVRMVLHAGEAAPDEHGDYLAAPLNRLARLLGIARGEQVLLTETVAQLAQDDLPPAASLRDLGEVQLRDLERAEHVFALAHPDLPADIPLPAALEGKLRHFPAAATPFVGREPLVAAVEALLAAPDVRLVTLTGPGGTGKTRLASRVGQETGNDFADGAVFVDLAPLHDPELVLPTIVTALGLREAPGRSLAELIADDLAGRKLLVVIDNFEHLLAAAPVVSEMLAAGPEVKVLVTSRAPLRLQGEHEYLVPPLELPDLADAPDLAALAANEAVALFIDRARAVRPDFALTAENGRAVAEICARLDGLPLAIELAAARVKLLPPAALLARLERRLPLLTGGARDAPARQRTLRDAIAWSYDLLTADEQGLFSQLSVFVGGWTLDAAEWVAGWHGGRVAGEADVVPPATLPPRDPATIDLLSSLVEISLVRHDASGIEPRYGMLETIRELGLERLASSGQEAEARSRFADWCLDFAERTGPRAKGPEAADLLAALEREHPNLRAALAWLVEEDDWERLVRLAGALWSFWQEHAHYSEGRRWLQAALEMGPEAPAQQRLQVLTGAGALAWYQADVTESLQLHEQALALAREIGDRAAEAFQLGSLAVHAAELGDHELAARYYEESLELARAIGAADAMVLTLHNLAHLDWERGDLVSAGSRLEEALPVAREQGMGWILPSIVIGLATIATELGDPPRAIGFFHESMALAQTRGNLGDVVDALEGLGRVAATTGQPEAAARLFGAADALRESIATPRALSEVVIVEPIVNAIRDALGEDRFAAAWARGRALSPEEAIAAGLAVRAQP